MIQKRLQEHEVTHEAALARSDVRHTAPTKRNSAFENCRKVCKLSAEHGRHVSMMSNETAKARQALKGCVQRSTWCIKYMNSQKVKKPPADSCSPATCSN